MPFANIDEKRAHQRAWYQKNRERVLRKGKRAKKEYFAYVHKVKDAPCLDCGVKHHPGVMDFHHRDPRKKKRGIGNFRSVGPALVREIAKCDLLCSNCHRMRHVEIKRGCSQC